MDAASNRQQKRIAELLNRIIEHGDSRALEVLMIQYKGFVRSIVHGMIRNTLLEDDTILNIFTKVFDILREKGYREKGSFKSWLGRVARNYCLDLLRRKRLKFTGITDENTECIGDGNKSPEEILIINDELRALLAMLSRHYREVIIKRWIEEKSPKETAAALGLTLATVRTSYYRAMERLKLLATGK